MYAKTPENYGKTTKTFLTEPGMTEVQINNLVKGKDYYIEGFGIDFEASIENGWSRKCIGKNFLGHITFQQARQLGNAYPRTISPDCWNNDDIFAMFENYEVIPGQNHLTNRVCNERLFGRYCNAAGYKFYEIRTGQNALYPRGGFKKTRRKRSNKVRKTKSMHK